MPKPRRTSASKELNQSKQDALVIRDSSIDLIAAMLAVHTPLTEVLAIVGENVVLVLPDT